MGDCTSRPLVQAGSWGSVRWDNSKRGSGFLVFCQDNSNLAKSKTSTDSWISQHYISGIPGRFDQAVILTNFFFFIQVCYGWPQKITYTNFQIFLKPSKEYLCANGKSKRSIEKCITFALIIQPPISPNVPHSTEYCRNMSEIFPTFYYYWNSAATFF